MLGRAGRGHGHVVVAEECTQAVRNKKRRLAGVLKSPADAAKASHKVGMGRVVRLTVAP
jgi:hypothetical protein